MEKTREELLVLVAELMGQVTEKDRVIDKMCENFYTRINNLAKDEAAIFSLRIDRLEERLRELTGQNGELMVEIDQLTARKEVLEERLAALGQPKEYRLMVCEVNVVE